MEEKKITIVLSNRIKEMLDKYSKLITRKDVINGAIEKYLEKAMDLYFEDIKKGVQFESFNKKNSVCIRLTTQSEEKYNKLDKKFQSKVLDRAVDLYFQELSSKISL